MIKQLIKDGTISIDYVKSEVNLADPLTKPLGRKLINETSRGMRLKPIWDISNDSNPTILIGDPMNKVHMGNNKLFANTASTNFVPS